MSLEAALSALRLNRDFMANVVAWQRIPARQAGLAVPGAGVSSRLLAALEKRGVTAFYRHQAAAITAALQGENVVIATGTASGKSLCYTVPVLQTLLGQPQARALYLFPSKALAHDQLAETTAVLDAGHLPIQVAAYDGDTPRSQRSQIRKAAGILITNPDMLQSGILPYHTGWRTLFSGLEYVVVDEIHTYRGVFGSHVANVLRRLQRICRFYGSNPRFICCSATIANPREHVERLVERPFTLVDESANGAPSGQKHFILYNPPVIDEVLGLRRSAVLTARDAAVGFLAHGIQTVVFGRTRQTVELLLGYLRDGMVGHGQAETAVAGYRGGYLPLERRQIEVGLRSGAVRGVVATNALELGIDVGELDAAVLTGFPGSIASTWQQAGRAGRRTEQSAVILVAGAGPLDQYICGHPRYLFGRSPEHALVNPDNPRIMANHLLCAAYELPFQEGEVYGQYGPVDEMLAALAEEGALHRTRGQYHWLGEGLPAHQFSLRTGGGDTVVIQDTSGRQPLVIGELELESAPLLVHEGAIYMHQAATYLVEQLDWDGRIAQVRPVEVDYYTRAGLNSTIRRLAPESEIDERGLLRAHGEVTAVTQATGYRKIKRYSHETVGFGEIDLPPLELETTGYWLVFSEQLTEQLVSAGILLRPNDYGPNWLEQRRLALARDNHRCQTCGAAAEKTTAVKTSPEGIADKALPDFTKSGRAGLHVHHIRPFREYNYVPGQNENYRQANRLENLVTLCPSCHRRAEGGQQTRSGLGGLAYVLGNLAPLFLMCDPADLHVTAESRNPLTQAPTVVVYERVPAGVGFSRRLFELHHTLLASALELVNDCRCREGCPACVGPPGEIGPDTKEVTRQLLSILN
jgi:DEAD/DEAH box helicase domain-containing protein